MRLIFIFLCIFPLQIFAATWHGLKIGQEFKGDLKRSLENLVPEKPYSSYKVDLNFDGNPEILVSYLCGNAGCENLIFSSNKDNEFIFVGSAFFHVLAFEVINNKKRQYGDILSYQRMSVDQGCLYRYNYSENGYTACKGFCGNGKQAFDIISPTKTYENEL